MTLAEPNQLLRNHIKHGKTVADNGVQLLGKTLFHKVGKRIAVEALGARPTDILQILLRALHVGSIGALGDGAHVRIDHIGNEIAVGNDHLVSFFLAEIAEFLQHLFCGTVVKPDIAIGILELHARKQDFSVDLIFLVEEMGITSSDDGLIIFLTQCHDLAIELAEAFIVCNGAFRHKETVIANGLNLEIIIKFHDLLDLGSGFIFDDRAHQFPCLTRGTHDQPLAVLFQFRLGNSGKASIIIEVAVRNQFVKIF